MSRAKFEFYQHCEPRHREVDGRLAVEAAVGVLVSAPVGAVG